MNVKPRFAILLGFAALGFLAALFLLQALDRTEAARLVADEQQNRLLLLNHWIDATGRTLPQFAVDYSQSDELARVAMEPTAVAREKIAADLAAAGAQALWILGPDGAIHWQVAARDTEAIAPPLARADFLTLVAETPGPRFFAEAGGQLLEVCIRRLPAAGSAARGWLMVARHWDEAQLKTLAALTDSRATLAPPQNSAAIPQGPATITLLRPLNDWQGHPVQTLRLDYEAPELSRMLQTDSHQAEIFIAFGLLVTAALGLALQGWVLRPLARIRDSLASGDTAPIRALRGGKDEFGRLARLVESSFAQRDELRREIEHRTRAQESLQRSEVALRRTMDERARLGRDLHDGVIQSLYAAGMGLAGIRPMLRPDQVEAAARLEQTRAALNETIHDVRNFISGLEPEALKLQSFTQAVATLLEVVQGLRPLRSTVEIDEAVAGHLTLAQRVHALQITREAVSNAIRHGDATQVTIALRPAGEHVEFEVIDNGHGFDPATLPQSGLGLGNFAERARELGADLTVESAPGRGTRVRLVFALYKSL